MTALSTVRCQVRVARTGISERRANVKVIRLSGICCQAKVGALEKFDSPKNIKYVLTGNLCGCGRKKQQQYCWQ